MNEQIYLIYFQLNSASECWSEFQDLGVVITQTV